MIKLNNFLKVIFHFINLFLILVYLYPGSLFGYIVYKDLTKQPQVTNDFFNISSNHFYAFAILSIFGVLSYQDKKKFFFLIVYLFLLSIILELFHYIIPERMFQFSDLLGNFFGVLAIYILYNIKKRYE